MKNRNKQQDKTSKEPFPPEHTPSPPQTMDPVARNERSKPDEEKQKKPSEKPAQQPGEKKLGDETEIHDETTI